MSVSRKDDCRVSEALEVGRRKTLLERRIASPRHDMKNHVVAVMIVALMLVAGMAMTIAWSSDRANEGGIPAEISQSGPHTTTWRMNGMFEEPFGEWWDERIAIYGDTILVHDSYPYVYASLEGNAEDVYSFPPGLTGYYEIYAPYRLNVSSIGVENWNTSGDADSLLLIPQLNAAPGANTGNISSRWYWQYLDWQTWDDIYQGNHDWNSYYGIARHDIPSTNDPTYGDDGWEGYCLGQMMFDREAAVKWLGAPMTGSLVNWYNSGTVDSDTESEWANYWTTRGNGDWDIFTAYDYTLDMFGPWNVVNTTLSGADNLVIDFWLWAWGWDTYLCRLLDVGNVSREFQVPTTEDTWLNVTVGPEAADVFFDAVACYSLYADKEADSWIPIWGIEASYADYVSNTASGQNSWTSKYEEYSNTVNPNLAQVNYAPGSSTFGGNVSYTYAPSWWNLSAGEHVIMTLPPNTTDVPGFNLVGNVPFTDADIYGNMFWGKMTFIGSDVDAETDYNPVNRTLIVSGPANPVANFNPDYPNLLDGGYPTWEFGVAKASYFDLQWEVAGDKMTTIPYNLTVTAMTNKTGTVVTDYNGTLTFSSTIPGVTLPSDYTFNNSGPWDDNGVHNFTVIFGSGGNGYVVSSDVWHAGWGDNVAGQVYVNILVIPEFAALLVPVVGMMAVFLIVRSGRHRRK
jgi:hypothetical protein